MKKHVIILHSDQQRYDSLGCNGNVYARTDNIDALAADGCNFSRHISANPTCMPSRASLLTGLYVPGHGVSSNGMPLWRRDSSGSSDSDNLAMELFNVKVQDKVPTMADILGDNGYQTALFGKLHLQPHLADVEHEFYESYSLWEKPETEELNEPYYGFVTKQIILGHGEAPCGHNRGHYGRWLRREHPELIDLVNPGEDANTRTKNSRDDIFISKIPSEVHNSMWLADRACKYLGDHQDDEAPIFMFVGFPDPHHPFSAPEDIANEFMDMPLPEFADKKAMKGKKAEAAMTIMDKTSATDEEVAMAYRLTSASIHLIDKAVGQIIDQLKALGIYEDSTIIFTSDHGDFLGDYHMLCKGNIAYDNLLHLPFIIKGSSDVSLPKTMDMPMSNVDVLPTVFDMIGVDKPAHTQGVNIFEATDNQPMVTCYGVTHKDRNISLYDHTYRYTFYIESKEEELYNHQEDPKELNNLADDPTDSMRIICDRFKAKLLEKHVECDLGIFNHYGLW